MFPSRIDRFPIEAGHILQFARAIGDPNPIYHDPDYAAAQPAGSIIAPPTFTEASMHFDTLFAFRPEAGKPWFGSGAGDGHKPEQSGAGTDLHAGTHFTYHAPLRPGMVLSARTTAGPSWEKEGKSGRLTFHETVNDFVDQQGQPVVTCRTTAVRTERTVAQPAARERPPVEALKLELPGHYPVVPASMAVGDRRRTVLVSGLSRSQIVMYAGASGDFSPQHTDEIFNTRVAGYPAMFGHGMLTMGMTGRMLTDWLGDMRLRTFSFTFLQQVWPGDSLVAEGVIEAVEAGIARIAIVTRNQYGEVVGKGEATA